jgi:hypothetical protein
VSSKGIHVGARAPRTRPCFRRATPPRSLATRPRTSCSPTPPPPGRADGAVGVGFRHLSALAPRPSLAQEMYT